MDGKRLAYLEYGDRYIFALVGDDVKVGDSYSFSLLNEKNDLYVEGKQVLLAVGEEDPLNGTFYKTEVKEDGDRVLHFFYKIGDYAVEAEKEHGYKINAIDGDACYKKTYRYTVRREGLRLAGEGEEGLKGRVVELMDYGNVCFARIDADGQEFLIDSSPDFREENVRVAFDSKDVSVYSIESDMKIC